MFSSAYDDVLLSAYYADYHIIVAKFGVNKTIGGFRTLILNKRW
jgi:hypothetical protein